MWDVQRPFCGGPELLPERVFTKPSGRQKGERKVDAAIVAVGSASVHYLDFYYTYPDDKKSYKLPVQAADVAQGLQHGLSASSTWGQRA
jgi:hypothetical protein